MCLESTQMLCTALNQVNIPTPYKSAHVKHPCTIWTSETRSNWNWLWVHAMALCSEYTKRYGKVHKCQAILTSIFHLGTHIPDGELTPFVNCAANQEYKVNYKHIKDVHKAYRLYLQERWLKDKIPPTRYKKPILLEEKYCV